MNFVGLFGWLAAAWRSRRALVDAAARGAVHRRRLPEQPRGERGRPSRRSCELQRSQERPIFLVPLILVWSRRAQRLVAPRSGTCSAALPSRPRRLRQRGRLPPQLQAGLPPGGAPHRPRRPFVSRAAPRSPTRSVARKARGTIHHHLARELRAAVGPPLTDAHPRRARRCCAIGHLREAMEHVAKQKGRSAASVQAGGPPRPEGDRQPLLPRLRRHDPAASSAGSSRRMYDRVEIDEDGLDRVQRAAAETPLVLTARATRATSTSWCSPGPLRARPHPAPRRRRHQPGLLALRRRSPGAPAPSSSGAASRGTGSTPRCCAPT